MSASPSSRCAGPAQKQITFDKVPLDAATEYAAEDADISLRLWQRLKPRLAAEGVTGVYQMVDRPLVATVGRMEQRGIKVDRDYLAKLSGTFATEIAKLEERGLRSRGGPVHHRHRRSNWARCCSTGSASRAGARARTATYSTDVTELERLAAEGVPVARLVLEWRQLTKLKSTYTDALQAQINPDTGRVHTSLQPVGGADRATVARPSRICRTSRSAPRSAARSAMPSSPSRAMC